MNTKLAITVLVMAFLLSTGQTAKADLLDNVGAIMLKNLFMEGCDGDKECESDVERQFNDCLRQSDFIEFMNSPEEGEDEILERTVSQISACILDKNGEPIFAQ